MTRTKCETGTGDEDLTEALSGAFFEGWEIQANNCAAYVRALEADVVRLRAALNSVLPLAKRACGHHPSGDWRTYDAAKAVLEEGT